MRRIDFTDAFPDDIEVALPDRVLHFPGDITVDDTVALTRACETVEQAATVDNIEQLADLLLTQFQQRHPDLDRLPIPAQLLVPFVYELYLGGDDTDDPVTDPPGADEAASTTKKNSGSRKPAARPRSKTSQGR